MLVASTKRELGMSELTADQLACELAQMDRETLIETLREMKCTFDLDFTNEFLDSVSIERLRHIALGASLHLHKDS